MKIMNPDYLKMKYPTPHDFKDAHPKSNVLIIGTGVSTKKILTHKDKLRNKFDAIIGVNLATIDFEEQMDYHIISEKNPVNVYRNINKKGEDNRKDLYRVFNWKTISRCKDKLNFVKMTRNSFDGKFDIREYKMPFGEGLLTGPLTKTDKLSTGTVTLQALHFASIIGAKNIYVSGMDFVFGEEFDHYYEDRLYRGMKKDWQTPIIKVKHDGKEYQTLRFWEDSAIYINKIIDTACEDNGIGVYSFSDGLITSAKKLNVDDFFKVGE